MEFTGHRAFAEHDDAVRFVQHLGQFRTDQQNGNPALGKIPQQPVNLRLGSDVNTTRRFVKNQHARFGQDPAAQHNLLLISPRQFGDRLPVIAAADSEDANLLFGNSLFTTRAGKEFSGQSPQARENRVTANRESTTQPLPETIFGKQRETVPDGLTWRMPRELPAIEFNRSR